MTEAGLLARLRRPLGTAWPNAGQALVLQAIFGPDRDALAAFGTWRDGVDLEGDIDGGVFRLLPLLYLRLAAMGVDDPLMRRLKGVYRRAWSDTHALFHATAPALEALHAAGIETLLLKGAPMVLLHYRQHGARPMADLDIAVRHRDLDAALHALAAAGWIPHGPISEAERRFRHARTFRGPAGQEMDLHWHMLFESGSDAADAPFWANRVPLVFQGIPTTALAPSLELVHILAHGLRPNRESPIRWVADALTLLRAPDATIDWAQVTGAAAELGLSRRIAAGLRYLRDLHGQGVPEAALRGLDSAPLGLAERLELAVVAPRRPRLHVAVLDRLAMLAAEFWRLRRADPARPLLGMTRTYIGYRTGWRLLGGVLPWPGRQRPG